MLSVWGHFRVIFNFFILVEQIQITDLNKGTQNS